MKSNPLQICFGLSILAHLVVFAVMQVVDGFDSRSVPEPMPEPAITVMLITAPPKISQPTILPVAPPPAVKPEPRKPVAPVPTVLVSENPVAAKTATTLPATASGQPARPDRLVVASGTARLGPDLTVLPVSVAPPVQAHPSYLKNQEPHYPAAARRRHQEGLVLLTVTVDAQGRVGRAGVKRTSGFPLLDEAALQSVRTWKFDPARLGSQPVESEIEVPVRFKLAD